MKMKMNFAWILAAAPMLAGPAFIGYSVEWKGEMRRVMREGDLTDRFDLRDLRGESHIYGLGPLSGLRGEITVFDSKPHVATVDPKTGQPRLEHRFDHRAPFFVWARVERWREVRLEKRVRSLEALGELALRHAKAAGLDTSRPFPFLLRGKAHGGAFHVLDRRGDRPHSHAEHDRIKARFPLPGKRVEVLGFWSDGHAGVWTHHGETLHAHVRLLDGVGSGHLDRVDLQAGAVLSLPSL